MFLNVELSREGKGEGPKDAKIVLIGEAYGAEEEKALRPFVGMAGTVLDQCLRAAGLVRSQLYITNLLNSRLQRMTYLPTLETRDLPSLV